MNHALRSSAAHVFVESVDAPIPPDDDAHHLFRVLRLRDGETVTVSDGRGAWAEAKVSGASLVPTGPSHHEPEPVEVAIAAAIPKGDRLEWMVQKLTEVGATRILLMHCARSVVRWKPDRAMGQLERLRRVSREAAMQSRRVWLPVVQGPVDFSAVAAVPGAALAEPGAGRPAEMPRLVLVGPEGGFSAEELSAPLPRIGLGDSVLRVETAALVAAVRALTMP